MNSIKKLLNLTDALVSMHSSIQLNHGRSPPTLKGLTHQPRTSLS